MLNAARSAADLPTASASLELETLVPMLRAALSAKSL